MKDNTKIALVLGGSLAVLGYLMYVGKKAKAAEHPLTPAKPGDAPPPSLPLPGAVIPTGPLPAPAPDVVIPPAIPTPAIPVPSGELPLPPGQIVLPGGQVIPAPGGLFTEGEFGDLPIGTVVRAKPPGLLTGLTEGTYKIVQKDKLVPEGALFPSWRYMGQSTLSNLLPITEFWQQDIVSVQ